MGVKGKRLVHQTLGLKKKNYRSGNVFQKRSRHARPEAQLYVAGICIFFFFSGLVVAVGSGICRRHVSEVLAVVCLRAS